MNLIIAQGKCTKKKKNLRRAKKQSERAKIQNTFETNHKCRRINRQQKVVDYNTFKC